MLNPFSTFDWKKSRPHLILLSKFQAPQEEGYQEWFHGHSQGDWADVLGEPLQKSIQRFTKEGMILRSNALTDYLEYKFKVSDLKNMLKQRNLAVSGNKDELIARLIEHDANGMKKAVSGLIVIRCSEAGKGIIDQFLAQEKQNKTNIEQQIAQAMREHRFKQAVLLFYRFESNETFPMSLLLSNQSPKALRKWWENHDPSNNTTILQLIFTKTPRILSKLNNEELESARIAAGMFELWETQTYLGSSKASPQNGYFPRNIALALSRHAYYCRNLEDYQKRGIKSVGIDTFSDSCEACKKIAQKRYKLNDVPELPYEYCESPDGCRCGLSVE
jgi:hypothetical protein